MDDLAEIAGLATEFIGSLDNLPQEVTHMLSELEHKEQKVQELLPKIAAREQQLRDISLKGGGGGANGSFSANGNAANSGVVLSEADRSKMDKLVERIRLDYAKVDEYSRQKEEWSLKLWRSIHKNFSRLETEMNKISPALLQSFLASNGGGAIGPGVFGLPGMMTPLSALPAAIAGLKAGAGGENGLKRKGGNLSLTSAPSTPISSAAGGSFGRLGLVGAGGSAIASRLGPGGAGRFGTPSAHLDTGSPSSRDLLSAPSGRLSDRSSPLPSSSLGRSASDGFPGKAPKKARKNGPLGTSGLGGAPSSGMSKKDRLKLLGQGGGFESGDLSLEDALEGELGLEADGDAEGDGEGEEKDETLYCFCQKVSYGEMIGCDADDCKYEWFHIGCVGVSKPLPQTWFCDDCLSRNKKKKK